MGKQTSARFTRGRAAALATLATLLALPVFAGCSTSTAPSPVPSSAGSPTAAQQVAQQALQQAPSPVGTSPSLVGLGTPAPTASEPYSTPTVEPKLPPPPDPQPMPVDSAAPAPNLAWGVETPDSLTIWVGSYSEPAAAGANPLGATLARYTGAKDPAEPALSWARPVVRWGKVMDAPIRLIEMAVSPDRKSLAVLMYNDQSVNGMEGLYPTWLSVVDLGNNKVQPIPDYQNNYGLYKDVYSDRVVKIAGWVDNNRLAVQGSGATADAIVIARDGAAHSPIRFPGEYASAVDIALSPDRATIFAETLADFWMSNIDGTNPRKIAAIGPTNEASQLTWSPDGKRVGYVSPRLVIEGELKYPSVEQAGVWVLDLDKKSQTLVSGEDAWNTGPAWSADGLQIAYIQADDAREANAARSKFKKYNSNIFVAEVTGSAPRKLTRFTGKKNSGLQWTPQGNILLASTAETQGEAPDLVVLQKKDGKTTKLSKKPSSNSDEAVVGPIIFK